MSATVKQLENQLNNAKKLVEKRDLVLKLSKIPEFKQAILEDFCVTECARYAQLSADPSMDEGSQKDALGLAQAAGHLRRYLTVVVQMGDNAENSIPALEDEIIATREEEDA